MSPRALDPLYRAREFPRMPSPRRHVQTQEQRLSRAERASRNAMTLATQPDSQTVQGATFILPPATLDDIGRTITVQSSAGPGSQIYIGVLDPFGVPQWLLLQSADTGGSGSGGTIGGATFTADHQWPVSAGIRTIALGTDSKGFIGGDNGDVRRFDPAVGQTTAVSVGFPPTTTIRGLSARTTGTGDVYVAGRSAKKLYRWNSSTSALVTSADTHTFVTARLNASDGFLYAHWGIASAPGGLYRYNANSLNLSATMYTSTGSVGLGLAVDAVSGDLIELLSSSGSYLLLRRTVTPTTVWGASLSRSEITSGGGIACDSTFVYVADSGANKIHVYLLSTGVYQGSFGSSGSALDQFSSPTDVTVSGANIYIVDFGNNRVTRWVKS